MSLYLAALLKKRGYFPGLLISFQEDYSTILDYHSVLRESLFFLDYYSVFQEDYSTILDYHSVLRESLFSAEDLFCEEVLRRKFGCFASSSVSDS